jgi:hypothetical protein
VLDLTKTEIDRKGNDIIPQKWISLFDVNTEIDDNGHIKGYMTINNRGTICEKQMTFIDIKYVFDTKINIPTDKLYVIGDSDFIGYNVLATMAYIAGFVKKLSLKAEIQLQKIELKNNRVNRVYVKKYGQVKTNIESEPVSGEDEITILKDSRVIETKGMKQNTLNVVKVVKLFGNDESELSKMTIKTALSLYINAVMNTAEQALERIIANNWKVLI